MLRDGITHSNLAFLFIILILLLLLLLSNYLTRDTITYLRGIADNLRTKYYLHVLVILLYILSN